MRIIVNWPIHDGESTHSICTVQYYLTQLCWALFLLSSKEKCWKFSKIFKYFHLPEELITARRKFLHLLVHFCYKQFTFIRKTWTSVAPRCHLVLVLFVILAKRHLYKCQEFYSFVIHRWMEYLSFVLVMHLLALDSSWKEYISMNTAFIGHFMGKSGTHKQTNSNFIQIDNKKSWVNFEELNLCYQCS